MTKRRVVITGMGCISPVGNTVEEAWENVKNGKSGVGKITLFDASRLPVKIAAEVKNFDIEKALSLCYKLLKDNGNIIIFQGWSEVCKTKDIMDSLFEQMNQNPIHIHCYYNIQYNRVD